MSAVRSFDQFPPLAATPSAAARALRAAAALWFRLRRRNALRRQRRALAELDRRLLDDVGLSRDDVRTELARSAWEDAAIRR